MFKIINQSLYRMSCTQCLRFQKKIRVMVSDHEFQLRKLSQDKAQDRVLYELNVQKELRKWQEKYNKQKQDHEENHKKWLHKIDQTIAISQLKISQHKKITHHTANQQKIQTKKHYQLEINRMSAQHQHQMRQLKITHQLQIQSTINAHRNQISLMKQKYQEQAEKKQNQVREKEEFVKRQYQSIILGLKSQKSAQQKQNIRLQQQHKRQRSKYLGQIYDNKIAITTFEQKVKELKENLINRENQIEVKKTQIIYLLQLHKRDMQTAENEREKLKRQWQECFQNQLKVFYERQLEITEQYQNNIKTIQEKRQNEQKLYHSNIQQVRACIDNRPSRIEDVQEILILRQRLSRKDRQYQTLEKQVKNYQLQLQNKQDTYNKMFIPTMNSAHLNQVSTIKRKQLKIKRPGKSVSTVRDILHAIGVPSNNLPTLNSIDKKLLPPRSTKIL